MATSAASPPANIGFTCSNEELFIAFNKLTSGSPLPSDVIDVNPYNYEPQNLPYDFWFLIKEKTDKEHGFWKTKEEACEVFSNPDIIGWRTTLEYCEGHEHKTDWVMQVFSTTQKRLCDDNEKKETCSLCRVFLVPSHEMQQKVSSVGIDTETRNLLTQPPVLDANSSTRIGSSSEANKHDETEVLAVAERLPVPEHQGENLVEMDFFSRGQMDFFSRDLEDPILEQNDAGKKLNVSASNKADEVLIVPAALESLVSVDGSHYSRSDEFFKPTGTVPNSASGSRDLNDKVRKHAKVEQRGEGPSTSSDSQNRAAAGGRKRAGFGGMRKLGKKCFCFMPF
ncbi:hypothetical protein REPUB_Repub19eG0033700 [Reevesia pubescens]